MKLRKLIKQNGKRCLYNSWGKATAIVLLGTAICLLFTMIEMIINMLFSVPQMVDYGQDGFWLNNIPNTSWLAMALTLIITVGSFLIMAPLNLGITGWYYGLSEGESPEVLSVFNCFSSRKYFRALSLEIHIWGRKLLLALLYFAIPAAVLAAAIWCLNYGPEYMNLEMSKVIGSTGILFAVLLALLMAVCYAIHIQKFFLARYYVVNEDKGVWEALKQSRHASKGRRGEILLFKLSFLPWVLSCVLVIPTLFVQPYYQISAMLYARVLMERHYRSTQIVPVTETEDLEQTLVFDFQNPDNE